MNGDKYFRLYYDNDYFGSSDKYYTQGILVELVHPAIKKFPLTKTLIHFRNSKMQYGLAIDHAGFTPSSIRHEEIIYGDRPFAAYIMLKTFSISIDTIHRRRLNTVLNIGSIGRAAYGEEIQQTIHRWIKNIQPLGWSHQIANDFIINYELNFENEMYHYRNLFSLNSNLQIRAGTLSDKAQIGFKLKAGKFNPVFTSVKSVRNNLQLYFYSQPLLSFIGYDATLQGGVFNNSPYIISARDISRITFQEYFGIVFSYRKLELEYFQSVLTKEFNTGTYHRCGGIRGGFSF